MGQSSNDRDDGTTRVEPLSETIHVDEVIEQLDKLETTVDAPEERTEVRQVRRMLERVPGGNAVGKRVEGYTTRDVAEGFVGSILISLPLLVEDGVYDIGDHLLEYTFFGLPIWFLLNVSCIVVLTWGLLYWTDIRDVRVNNPIFGIVPQRLVGILAISFCTASASMTLWGRVDNWEDPAVALARISVIWAAAAFGAALGDILPGKSTGRELDELLTDIRDERR